MRPIKFRAWDTARKQWMGESSVYALLEEMGIIDTDYGDRYAVEQFTGLRDKNGREIYEGDILLVNLAFSGDVIEGPVEWDKFQWAVHGWALQDPRGGEVLGNVHENPDLLK